ncbi:hypothetical protein FJT64_004406 [Amphibalanus amphitrite]|uniref:Peptidase A2 domain-containing protein n=1 Tax=Amphibalanus amphitrite TaxID=1232801 RepID=A0A6A4VVI3_AMPAM|nr:hypothetical protein FJT64_004406 [Amphibalanus amphitrite]
MGPKGEERVKMLIDTGSNQSFVTKRLAARLGCEETGEQDTNIMTFGGDENRHKALKRVSITLKRVGDEISSGLRMDMAEIDTICGAVNTGLTVSEEDLDQLKDLVLLGVLLAAHAAPQWRLPILPSPLSPAGPADPNALEQSPLFIVPPSVPNSVAFPPPASEAGSASSAEPSGGSASSSGGLQNELQASTSSSSSSGGASGGASSSAGGEVGTGLSNLGPELAEQLRLAAEALLASGDPALTAFSSAGAGSDLTNHLSSSGSADAYSAEGTQRALDREELNKDLEVLDLEVLDQEVMDPEALDREGLSKDPEFLDLEVLEQEALRSPNSWVPTSPIS